MPEPDACPCCMPGAHDQEPEGRQPGSPAKPSRRAVLQAGALAGGVLAVPRSVLARPARRRPARPSARAVAARLDWPIPDVVTRAQWGADESLRITKELTSPPDYDAVVTKLIVHHTASANNPGDPAAAVRSVYQYHVTGVYLDIAYNWLIDQNGRIYEGRWARDYPNGVAHTGELEDGRQVRGGHSANTNTQSCGIALLGTFTTGSPTDAALEALVTVLAWKCARWGIDPNGSGVYAPDGRVFANICGHRDTSATSCPGDALESLLPDLRARVAARLESGTGGFRKVAAGYWVASSAGTTVALGDTPKFKDLPPGSRVQSMVATPGGSGYWLLGADGGVFTFGDAPFFGSTGATRLNRPIVAMAPTPSGRGYWLCASDGGIFSFGDAPFFGSTGAIRLNRPIVAMAPTPSGRGYWLCASDGGIFSFGGAPFFGSTGAIRLNRPIVAMAPTPSGRGYWLCASDGGIFSFGDAPFFGSTGGIALNQPIADLATSPSGLGYWLLARDGGVFAFGDASFRGSAAGKLPNAVGLAVHTSFAP
ncbi:MAG: peptidoglycan recognition family protein [Acidimicrobiia bacterium]